MASVKITDLPIHVYMPMEAERHAIAMIGDLPMVFKAAPPMAARKTADEWRAMEHQKIADQKARAQQRAEEAAAKRAAKAEAAQ